jgi:hypothetical protein
MSSRSLGTALAIAATFSPMAGLALVGGCSEDDPAGAAPDAAADGNGPEANRPTPPEPDAEEPKSCRQRCEEAIPEGALAKDEAINSCWKTFCGRPCIEELAPDGGVAADGAAPDGGTCVSPVVTISLACDECTNTFCCASWDGCFQDPECSALNVCYQQCTE